jgi:LuxR family transcriptional regulator, regulator of acetate metabolism
LGRSCADSVLAYIEWAEEMLGCRLRPDGFDPAQVDEILETLDRAVPALLGRATAAARERHTRSIEEICDLAVALDEIRRDLSVAQMDQRTRELHSIGTALARLRTAQSVAQLLTRGPAELCGSGGFDRAAVKWVRNNALDPVTVHFAEHAKWAMEFHQFLVAHPIPLTHGVIEGEAVRRAQPIMILDTRRNPHVFGPMIEFTKSRSYVVAPVLYGGRPVATLHADNYFSERQITSDDRDLIWAFAEGFSYAVERCALLEKLRSQEAEVARLMRATEASVSSWTESELILRPADEGQTAADEEHAQNARARPLVRPHRARSELDELLTRREVEVLELLAKGASNLAIAERLYIAEGTAKSHVKRILRKLGVSNRAEAVAYFFRAS